MVTIKTQNSAFDNGTLDMVMNMMYVNEGDWNCPKEFMCLDFRETKYKDRSCEVEKFEHGEDFVDRNWKTNEIEGPAQNLGSLFPMEKLIKWDEDNFIKYPLIKINSIKFYPDTYTTRWSTEPEECLTIEVDSDNDEAVVEIFTMLAGLANGGHCCGGYIRINEEEMQKGGHVANFGLDGDGCDRIFYVNDQYLD